ncbi:CCA tRNA nucleotidyltransferase [Sporolituus thermophilus]|uniref:tRNA nucleotidyltransferase/poly(A) polymerase n=1 Tax=Sporolituus thermophilus DSM 23256 TaxID=1123285 RepID=A0A1G7JUU7_9FIRM|nr:HD domain-containing protein [Sporolituus thermophilus]SDF28698.1 tRNA nucleotidyltransferase/poly(A) polymerase [Sporolituus thermophilus DSM 23256]
MIETVPSAVRTILTALVESGHAAYIAGGAVRDFLAGRPVNDYDIATSARPDAVKAIAAGRGWQVVDRLGTNYGVVMVVVDGTGVEVATFRGERYGEDSHRPAQVWYADTIEEDLGRRDFTVNAMAMDVAGNIIDPFGGRRDLAARLIRTVGDPGRRFGEDALRMLRACRFAAQLGFAIDDAVLAAIGANLGRMAGLSLERVRLELDKLLLGDYPHLGLAALVATGLAGASCRVKEHGEYQVVAILPELNHLVGLPQNPAYHAWDGWRHTLETVRRTPSDLTLRWAALLHDIGKGLPGVRAFCPDGQPTDHGHDRAGAKLAAAIAARLRFPAQRRERLVWLVANHMRFHFYAAQPPAVVLRWVRREARSGRFASSAELADAFAQLAELGAADAAATGQGRRPGEAAKQFGGYVRQLAAAMPVHTRDLAYDAGKLKTVLGDGQAMGEFLRAALRRVQDGQLENEPAALCAAASKWRQRRQNNRAGETG